MTETLPLRDLPWEKTKKEKQSTKEYTGKEVRGMQMKEAVMMK